MVDAKKPKFGLDDIDPSRIPEELKALPFWNMWRANWNPKKGKFNKIPLSVHTGRHHDVQDVNHLATFDVALEGAKRANADGIGFSFAPGCGFVGLDFDHCVTDGIIHPTVKEVIEHLGYCEISPSGSGVKVWVRADIKFDRNKVENFPVQGIETECYNWGRYFTLTSQKVEQLSNGLADQTSRLRTFCRWIETELEAREKAKRAAKATAKKPTPKRQAKGETQNTASDLSDRDLWDAAFGNQRNGSEIEALYRGDWQGYESQSQADLVLCNHLAFYTSNDDNRMDRMFRESGLFRPEKWDRYIPSWGRTYGENTIAEAVAITANLYEPRNPDSESDKNAQAADVANDEPGEWTTLVPLDDYITPEWQRGLMPDTLERYTDAVSELNQTPRAQAKMMSIPILSAGAQGQYKISFCGRTENLATYVCTAASTGERKSSDIKRLRKPIAKFEALSQAKTLEKQKQDAFERELLTDRVDKLRKDAVKSGEEADKAAYLTACNELADTYGKIVRKRLVTQDVTPEELVLLASEQDECMTVLSAEGGPLENIKSKYQKNAKVATIYLEGFSGDEVHRDRLSARSDGKPSTMLRNPALSMGVMTQPEHLSSILADKDFQGRGLVERFLWCMPEERIGYRGRGKAIPQPVADAYFETMKRMLPEPGYRRVDAAPNLDDDQDENTRITLYVGGDGTELLDAFEIGRLEPRFRPGGDLREVRGWGTRLPTAAIKIAALWHIYAAAERNQEVPQIIDIKWIRNAIKWIEEFAIPMGIKTFGLMGSDPGVGMARRILEEIREHGYGEFSQSEFKRSHFKNSPAADVKQGYEVLLERGYLGSKKVPTAGRSAVVYEVNPEVFNLPEGPQVQPAAPPEPEPLTKQQPQKEEPLQPGEVSLSELLSGEELSL